VSNIAVWAKPAIDREPPQTLRLVTANRKERSERLLSGGTSGWSRKYHRRFTFSVKSLAPESLLASSNVEIVNLVDFLEEFNALLML
jgi:hypothetical protein